jgi:hypothetical protein
MDELCGQWAGGGLYYSIGPFSTAGDLALSTGYSQCFPVGAGVMFSLYDSSASDTCIASSGHNSGYSCASLAHRVTAADVESHRTFLVRVSVSNAGHGAPMFTENNDVRIALSDCSPVTSPSPDATPSPSPEGNADHL